MIMDVKYENINICKDDWEVAKRKCHKIRLNRSLVGNSHILQVIESNA